MLILGIETSCDETAAAVVAVQDAPPPQSSPSKRGRTNEGVSFTVCSSIIASQIDIHAKTGGVVPEVAAREHVKAIIPVIDEALERANITFKNIDLIAVTHGPGLVPALLVGLETAKTLSWAWNKPLVGVNHLAGHVYANWLTPTTTPTSILPLFEGEDKGGGLALIVSGGHTELVLMRAPEQFELIGQTKDDAAGEAFDKIAKLIGLPYPGGPHISRLAREGNPNAIDFPRPMIDSSDFNMSFSGLKTAALYWLRENECPDSPSLRASLRPSLRARRAKQSHQRPRLPRSSFGLARNDISVNDFCASFEQAIVDVLVAKTKQAAKRYNPRTILLGGGVAANERLRATLRDMFGERLRIPMLEYCTDNAAMIAAAGYFAFQNRGADAIKGMDVDPRLPLPCHSEPQARNPAQKRDPTLRVASRRLASASPQDDNALLT